LNHYREVAAHKKGTNSNNMNLSHLVAGAGLEPEQALLEKKKVLGT